MLESKTPIKPSNLELNWAGGGGMIHISIEDPMKGVSYVCIKLASKVVTLLLQKTGCLSLVTWLCYLAVGEICHFNCTWR